MRNKQLIKSAQVWIPVVLLFGVIVFAGKAGSKPVHLAQNANSSTSQNQNQNQNQNQSQNQNTAGMSSKDRDFLMDAAMGGLIEVQLGRWAAQKGTSEEVKQFGRRMVDDHSRANTELMALASSKGVALPTAIDEKHQKDISKIVRLQGAEFDKAYSKAMLKDHEGDVSDFEKQSTNAADADVKAFATKTLPVLREHLELARALPANAKPNKSNSNSNSKSSSNSNSNRP